MFAAGKTSSGAAAAGAYQISRSLRFNEADTAYLNRTPATTTNRRTWTWSGWVKRGVLGGNDPLFTAYGGSASTGTYIIFNPSADAPQDGLQVAMYTGSHALLLRTSAVFRDPSAWYHIVVAMDTTQATSSDRVKIYVNGVQITSFNTATYPSQNLDTDVNTTREHAIGRFPTFSQNYDGLMTETYLIDGQALTPSSFGETNAQTGVWQPKAYSGSYGTNGFYVNFSDNSNTTAATLGKDYSGNGNNWTPNNFSVTAGAGNDSLVDSPTSYGTDTGVGGTVRGNYATLNPLAKGGSFSNSPTNGNLDIISATTPNYGTALATMGMISGKWYWEVTNNAGTAAQSIGLAKDGVNLGSFLGSDAYGWTYLITGQKQTSGSGASYGASYTTNDIIGVAFDADAGTLVFYKNGTSQGTAYTGLTSGYYYPAVGDDSGANQASYTLNFGQRPFAYTAPSGYKALCTQNLPTPTIGATTATQAGKFFNTVLYTGNSSTLAVTGVGFQPDLVWGKSRSAALNHRLFDAVRGVTKRLSSNLTDAEATESGVTAFNSDGFTLGSDQGLNFASDSYVAWNWKANGAGSTNTAGQITSTVSANTTSGFSVVTFTTDGTTKTVGHGLGVKPSLIIAKVRNGAGSWIAMTDIINGSMQYGALNSTAAFASIGYSAPTSTVFQYNDNNGNTQVAYCFAEIAGYSKIGTYTGNGSADGPFVYCGFRPAFMMIKFSSTTGDWALWDTKRAPYNAFSYYWPTANTSNSEQSNSAYLLDILSNGFKIRGVNDETNLNGQTLIFMAFAESPFKYALAR